MAQIKGMVAFTLDNQKKRKNRQKGKKSKRYGQYRIGTAYTAY